MLAVVADLKLGDAGGARGRGGDAVPALVADRGDGQELQELGLLAEGGGGNFAPA